MWNNSAKMNSCDQMIQTFTFRFPLPSNTLYVCWVVFVPQLGSFIQLWIMTSQPSLLEIDWFKQGHIHGEQQNAYNYCISWLQKGCSSETTALVMIRSPGPLTKLPSNHPREPWHSAPQSETGEEWDLTPVDAIEIDVIHVQLADIICINIYTKCAVCNMFIYKYKCTKHTYAIIRINKKISYISK